MMGRTNQYPEMGLSEEMTPQLRPEIGVFIRQERNWERRFQEETQPK